MLHLLLAVALVFAPTHDVLVVDDNHGPATEFATIQAAIDAAVAGDTVLVRPGTYAAFSIAAKAVSVVGSEEGGERPRIQGSQSTVQGLAPGQAVVLRGFDLFSSLGLQDCLGPVLVEDMDVDGILVVADCEDVVLVRSRFAPVEMSDGGAILRSSIYGYGAEFYGKGPAWPGESIGLSLVDSFAFLSDAVIGGGKGVPGHDGNQTFPFCTSGGIGGVGLKLVGSTCMSLGSTFHGGLGGPPGTPLSGSGFGPCSTGPSGPPVSGSGLTELPGVPRAFEIGSPGVEGASVALLAQGLAGEFVYAFVGFGLAPLWFPAWSGALAVSPSSPLLFVGVLPGSGVISANVGVGDLGPGIEGVDLIVQPVFVPVIGGVVLGPPSAVELIDQGMLFVDCNGNGVSDELDLLAGTSLDCNGNAVPDECDIASGDAPDCNGNGVPDGCDLAAGTSLDLNENGQPDECDIVLVVPDQYPTIQAAVNAAQDLNIVLVRDGVYTGHGNSMVQIHNKNLVVRSEHGSGSTTIKVPSGPYYAIRMVNAPGSPKLIGFTIRDAITSMLAPVIVENSPITIRDCVFVNNKGGVMGSALYISGGEGQDAVRIEDCSFLGNSSDNAPLRLSGPSSAHLEATVSNCAFLHNVGGPDFLNAGAIFASDVNLHLRNSSIAFNSGGFGAILHEVSCDVPVELEVRGCTVFGNDTRVAPALSVSTYTGGGCTPSFGSAPVVVENTILWANTIQGAGGIQADLSAAPGAAVRWTAVEGGAAGIASASALFVGPGILAQDPLLVGSGDLHLSLLSPCIHAGDPAYVPLPGETDIDGQPRVAGPAIDLGSDELHP